MSTNIEDPAYRDPFHTRIRRAESWLACARKEHASGDLDSGHWDVAFVLYWIAFNAAFATEDYESPPRTHREFRRCFERVVRLDRSGDIHGALMRFSGSIRELVSNEYLFKRYWFHVNGRRGHANWRKQFDGQVESVENTVRRASTRGTKTIISIVFQRLCTLRNQIVHGGATWKSRYNRSSVAHGLPIMAELVPAFVGIVRRNPQEEWGHPYYRPGLQGKLRPE